MSRVRDALRSLQEALAPVLPGPIAGLLPLSTTSDVGPATRHGENTEPNSICKLALWLPVSHLHIRSVADDALSAHNCLAACRSLREPAVGPAGGGSKRERRRALAVPTCSLQSRAGRPLAANVRA